MTKIIIRCTGENQKGATTAVPAQEAFIDGYQIAERLLEGVPIRIFHTETKEIDVEICLDDKQMNSLCIDKDEIRKEVLLGIEEGRFDVLGSTKDMTDDDMSIYDDDLPNKRQAFGASPKFVLQR